ncbi:MAG TPA: hypothetical protein VFH80_05590 [Solirubrobacteraceae bacterium]|nr:hypothetical protein [Solirubrobacteraceae bacterium]
MERDRLAVLPLLLRLALLRLLPALFRRVPLDPLPLERDDELRPDEPPELEPLLLA